MEYLVWALAVLLRVVVGLWEYSGAGVAPMYGDFEAQRHWLEITIALPIGDWYRHTASNDLQYWGLDYPPLTAYVSYGFGRIAEKVVPALVTLLESRGHESVNGKLFMRASVVALDIVLLIPIMSLVCKEVLLELKRSGKSISISDRYITHFACLTIPGLLLIDHGHFQYNGVCLALALLGALLVSKDYDITGSIFFCLSLNFKQMSLYYAPVFFCFLLRKCITQPTILAKILSFAKLGVTVVSTFGLLWAPFCVFHSPDDTCVSSLGQVLHRQFPFARGIFEDKVANLWYTLSVAVDFREHLSAQQLLASSLTLTLLLLVPTCAYLLTRRATFTAVLFALMNSSLAFFLASFQVHEKSVLLMLAPAAPLLLLDKKFFCFVQLLGCFTMFPLLVKDKLRVPYLACCALYLALAGLLDGPVQDPSTSATKKVKAQTMETLYAKLAMSKGDVSRQMGWLGELLAIEPVKSGLIGLSAVGMVVLHLLEIYVPAPQRLPDLYAALFSIFGAANLCAIYVVGVCWLWWLPSVDTHGRRLKNTVVLDTQDTPKDKVL